ncbi:MAG: aldose 1-epimerase family protein [Rectinemataceae bacterium]|jgi:hypothetical protein
MKINGMEMSRNEVQKRTGNLSQLGTLRHYQLIEGKACGVVAADFRNYSGFEFTVLPGRAMDISCASYKGTGLVFHTPSGEVHAGFYNSAKDEWLRSFFGGLLTTCGLTYFGHSGKDGDEELGLHGRVSNIPAKKVCDNSRWDGDEYVLNLSGVVEEASLFGHKLRLERSITSRLGEKKLEIHDKVTNIGFEDSPFNILYHLNMGYPLLDDGCELWLTSDRKKGGEASRDDAMAFSGPIKGFKEQLFLHSMLGDAQGYALAGFINKKRGLGLYIRFKADTLPYLNEWKMLGCGEYVVGIEPMNSRLMNRGLQRQLNILPMLHPGEEREMRLEIGMLDGSKEIEAFRIRIEEAVRRPCATREGTPV